VVSIYYWLRQRRTCHLCHAGDSWQSNAIVACKFLLVTAWPGGGAYVWAGWLVKGDGQWLEKQPVVAGVDEQSAM